MKPKTQIIIYQNLVSKLGGKYDGAEEFINIRVNELCSEHGTLEEEEVCFIFLCYAYSLATYTVYSESFALK